MDEIDLYKLADSIFERLNEVGYEKLTHAEKVFVCVWSLEGEVNNGGFSQWLFNSSGDWAIDTPESLNEIGANETAQLVNGVMSIFPGNSIPRNIDERRTIIEKLDEKTESDWNDADNEFYRYKENIENLLTDYVSKNKVKYAL